MKRRLISTLLTCAMLFSLTVPFVSTQASYQFTINEALDVLKYLAGLAPLPDVHGNGNPTRHYDVDNNDVVNINDALEILKGLAGIGPPAVCNCFDLPSNGGGTVIPPTPPAGGNTGDNKTCGN